MAEGLDEDDLLSTNSPLQIVKPGHTKPEMRIESIQYDAARRKRSHNRLKQQISNIELKMLTSSAELSPLL